MSSSSADSNKRKHSRKRAPKLKNQRTDEQILTGSYTEAKGVWYQNGTQGHVVQSFLL